MVKILFPPMLFFVSLVRDSGSSIRTLILGPIGIDNIAGIRRFNCRMVGTSCDNGFYDDLLHMVLPPFAMLSRSGTMLQQAPCRESASRFRQFEV